MPQTVEKFKTDAVLTLTTSILVSHEREPDALLQDVQALASKIVGYTVLTHHLVKPEIYKAATEFVQAQYPNIPGYGSFDFMDILEQKASLILLVSQLGPEITLAFETKEEETNG